MHGLQKEYTDRVGVEVLDATTPENKQKIQNEFGFKSHGLVIYDGTGGLSQKLDGHLLKEAAIREALNGVLGDS